MTDRVVHAVMQDGGEIVRDGDRWRIEYVESDGNRLGVEVSDADARRMAGWYSTRVLIPLEGP